MEIMEVITVSKLEGEINMKVSFSLFYRRVAVHYVCEAMYWTGQLGGSKQAYMVAITAAKPGMGRVRAGEDTELTAFSFFTIS